MKKADSIIKHIKKSPSLKKINQVDCYETLINLLPKNIKDGINYVYSKNDTLFFVLKHPCYKIEFDYRLSLIKGLLKKMSESQKSFKIINASKITAFVTNKPEKIYNEEKINNLNTYYEKSNGCFENLAKDSAINKEFEEIRTIIKKCCKIK